MLETLLGRPFFLNRHRKAPLLKEREAFLHYLQQEGTSRAALRNLSQELLSVVCLLKCTRCGMWRWRRSSEQRSAGLASNGRTRRRIPMATLLPPLYAAKKWLRFHAAQVAKHVAQRPAQEFLFFSLLLQFTSCGGDLGSSRFDNAVR